MELDSPKDNNYLWDDSWFISEKEEDETSSE
jgi:hypothetical protein